MVLMTSTVWPVEENLDQQFEGFNLQGYTNTGKKSWDVSGDTADVSGTKIKLSNVNANSYGEQQMNVTAETGYIDRESGHMRLETDVVITSDDGSKLMTDSIEWDREKDLVKSDDDVFISNDRFTATGKGMQAKPGLKNVQIKKDVTVRLKRKDKQKKESQTVTITSDGPMIIDQLLSKARFEVNVVAVQDDQILRADVMEIYFDESMSNLKKMVCVGNVEIIQGENRTYADKAVYNAVDQKLILSGRPKLIFQTEGENGLKPFGD